MSAARQGNGERAAELFERKALGRGDDGPNLALQLQFVLDQKLWVDWDSISDDPEGRAEDGAEVERIGAIAIDGGEAPIQLRRVGQEWWIARETVQAIPALYAAYGGGPLLERVPDFLFRWRFLEIAAWQWIAFAGGLLFAAGAGLFLGTAFLFLARQIVRRTPVDWDTELVETAAKPVRFFGAVLTGGLIAKQLHLAAPVHEVVDLVWRILLVVSVTWFSICLVGFLSETVQREMSRDGQDEARARSIRTQVVLLRRIALAVVWALAAASLLMQFEVVRTVGVSLLASAGIAGVVLGLAAQRSLTTLFAGIQLSFTQPVRIGDQVIVEGEWGTVEEIHLTYAVVQIWDQRRLVLPITWFLEKPFQNWTRRSTELLGAVEIYADFTVPVEAAREELQRVCSTIPQWDGREASLRVTGMSERTMLLRCLVSARNAPDLFVLRCEVREKMIGWLQRFEGGRYLPKSRHLGEAEAGSSRNVAVVAELP